MQKITTTEELRAAIRALEIKQANEGILLKEQFKITFESLKPANLIKKTINDLITSPDVKDGLFGAALSMAAGYLTKKVVVGATHNPIKQLLGTLLQLGVTKIVSKNSDGLGSSVMNAINTFLKKKDIPA